MILFFHDFERRFFYDFECGHLYGARCAHVYDHEPAHLSDYVCSHSNYGFDSAHAYEAKYAHVYETKGAHFYAYECALAYDYECSADTPNVQPHFPNVLFCPNFMIFRIFLVPQFFSDVPLFMIFMFFQNTSVPPGKDLDRQIHDFI